MGNDNASNDISYTRYDTKETVYLDLQEVGLLPQLIFPQLPTMQK